MPAGRGAGPRGDPGLTAEGARRAALFLAVVFPGMHLFLLLGILPALVAGPPGGGEPGGRIAAAGLFLVLGALGALALWLPMRALSRATAWRGVALLAWGALYAALAALAATDALDGAGGAGAVVHGLALWLHLPLTVFLILTGGLLRSTEVLAGVYVLALLAGGLLTVRAARRPVDARPGRR